MSLAPFSIFWYVSGFISCYIGFLLFQFTRALEYRRWKIDDKWLDNWHWCPNLYIIVLCFISSPLGLTLTLTVLFTFLITMITFFVSGGFGYIETVERINNFMSKRICKK